ncbi:MAG: NAD(P)H-dependent glycerol-3-phosphate dehydrogenase [Alphaproteobacteria bacterium]
MVHRKTVTILGGGAWGCALAMVAEMAGSRPIVWMRDPEDAAKTNRTRMAPRLSDFSLDEDIIVTADIAEAVGQAKDAVVLAVPAQAIREVTAIAAPYLSKNTPLILAAKGIETETGRLLSEVIEAILPQTTLAVLSGPSFADEVARGFPTGLTLACRDTRKARHLASLFMLPHFRPYISNDPIAAEIGGALKNVMAIAAGIIIGRKLGENARATLLTRGLGEMIRLGKAKGAKAATFSGLSGLGDLILSATSERSRNYALGIMIGRGTSVHQLIGNGQPLVEGVPTAAAATLLASTLNIDMPITAAVDAILHLGARIEDRMIELLARPIGRE